jgi:phosphoribosylanthranilate isomerase
MSVFVKICGLGSKEQVDAAIAAGADAVGFVFAESIRRIAPKDAAAISADVPAHIKRVAVMLHPTNDDWQQVLQEFTPDVLQTDADDYAALSISDSIERWPVFREGGSPADTQAIYVFEGVRSGQGETVDWSQAANIARSGQMILAGGLAAANVAAAIAKVQPFGVDVSSAVEYQPGQKDTELIEAFVSAAKAAEKNL